MANHTPGPWTVERDPCHFHTASSVRGGASDGAKFPGRQLMAEVGGFADVQEQEANAALIAAAPDLLDACEQVLIASEDNGDMDDIDWNQLRAAIAKARQGGGA